MNQYAILLTCCVSPHLADKSVFSEDVRRQQYKDAVNHWLFHRCVEAVVIVENSGTPVFEESEVIDKSLNTSKYFEQLVMPSNHFTESEIHRGIGYLEHKTVMYAIKESKFLANSMGFFKVSGRLRCLNFDNVIRSSDLPLDRPAVNAWPRRFFGTDVRADLRMIYYTHDFLIAFDKNFASMIDDRKGLWLERLMALATVSERSEVGYLTPYPRLVAVTAGSGIGYDGSSLRLWLAKAMVFAVTKNNRFVIR